MEIVPVPVVAPIVFAEVVPMLTVPAKIEIPQKIPGATAEPLVVE